MKDILTIIQVIVGIILSGLVLLQAKGVGLGRTFGSTNYHSKRGLEKIVFRATIISSCIFVATAIVAQLLV